MVLYDPEGNFLRISAKAEIDVYKTMSGKFVGVWEKAVYEAENAPKAKRIKVPICKEKRSDTICIGSI